MKLLVTGSAGLIGSALSSALKKRGIKVIGIDIKAQSNCEDYGDILDYNRVLDAASQVDGIVHLAAVSRVIWGEENPKFCWETNVEGTKHILEAALESPLKPWVLYGSSREVYGQQERLPVKETAPLAPVNIYGESKVAAEQAVKNAVKRGLKGSIVRFSNVFGSVNDHHDRVIPAFCLAAFYGTPIRIDGRENLFDFTFIDDVVRGMLSYIDILNKSPIPLMPIHFTTGLGVSLEEAAFYAQEASVHNIEIIEAPSRSFDVSKFSGETSRAREILKWKASVHLREGIHQMLNQLKSS
ncbi:UDP-glucose 4-epimerase [Candidatus Rhabdochlamydia oedothoracis]|uniref:UDP-glucose 4-epimerase n=2 Tax=Candidatus Rhabdochlamydia oedothoracis TaxID=2720720 RepID=A0ABX8V0T7_9BACT|nr:NAD(P)-dependent oxidoreductase [Candidatus Rhabdochlamydia sp. W815]KAG6559963.1 UDP-glucose 4-epimerase [Candidatus Rhabdochlamydia sp. W815]MCL6756301.1 NAD(P)-dependent oxidoreductase [Candidatus Rhabdochlamydia oedothoracis]QYF48112.1 UDP-glucose 4-epimerase [Candidatus Rhabdochlamydia oedothoracis]